MIGTQKDQLERRFSDLQNVSGLKTRFKLESKTARIQPGQMVTTHDTQEAILEEGG